MPHEGYADPIMNNRLRFHLDMPVSELTECVTRAIEASDVSSAPLVARNHRRGNAQNSTDPYQSPIGLRGSRHLKTASATNDGSASLHRLIPWLCPTQGSTSSVSPDP